MTCNATVARESITKAGMRLFFCIAGTQNWWPFSKFMKKTVFVLLDVSPTLLYFSIGSIPLSHDHRCNTTHYQI